MLRESRAATGATAHVAEDAAHDAPPPFAVPARAPRATRTAASLHSRGCVRRRAHVRRVWCVWTVEGTD